MSQLDDRVHEASLLERDQSGAAATAADAILNEALSGLVREIEAGRHDVVDRSLALARRVTVEQLLASALGLLAATANGDRP